MPIWRRNIFTVCQLLVPSASSQNAILCGRLRYGDAEPINNVLVWLQTSKSGLFKLVHDLFLLFWCQYAIGCPETLSFNYGTFAPELGFLELYGMQIGIKNAYLIAHYFAYQDFHSTLLNRINDASKNRSHIPHAQCVKIFLKLFLNYRSD